MNIINLDLKTFLFCMGLVGLVFSVMSFAFSRLFPEKIKGLFEWSLALLFSSTSFICFMLRDVVVPLVSHLFANGLILVGNSFFLLALLKYHGKNRFYKWIFVTACFLLLALGIDYFQYGETIGTSRSLIIILPSIGYLMLTSWLILRNDRNQITLPSMISSVSLVLLTLSLLARVYLIVTNTSGASLFQVPSPAQVAFLTYAAITVVSSSLGFILMAIEKLNYEVIHQTAQAEHSNRLTSLGEMAAGIAHEINNPLTIIQFNFERLQTRLPEEIAKKYELSEIIQKSGIAVTRVSKIVKGLLDFSKEGNSQEMTPHYLKAIIDDTLTLCFEKIRSKGIRLELDPVPQVRMLCNNVQISQILLNLINNALDSLETVENSDFSDNKYIRIHFLMDGKTIKIFVENSGRKISQLHRDKIFLPFFTTKEVGKGTGLGLSISLGIAQKHRGNLYLDESRPMTTFVLQLKTITETSSV